MPKLNKDTTPRVHSSLTDKSEERIARLRDDVQSTFRFVDGSWAIDEVAEDWLIIAILNTDPLHISYQRVLYTEHEGSFVFSGMEAVERVTFWDAIDAQKEVSLYPANLTESAKREALDGLKSFLYSADKDDSFKVKQFIASIDKKTLLYVQEYFKKDAGQRCAKRSDLIKELCNYWEIDPVEYIPVQESKPKMERLQSSIFRCSFEKTYAAPGSDQKAVLAKKDKKDKKKTKCHEDEDGYPVSPTGKRFLAVFNARASVVDRVNYNGHLYPREVMQENVTRIQESIERAYQAGQSGLALNMSVQELIGERDHPGMCDGPRLAETCTMLLGIDLLENDDIVIEFGVMDVAAGRDTVALIDYGVPHGISTRGYGGGEDRVMNEENPLIDKNPEFVDKEEGNREYFHITNLFLEACDLVVHPAAGTYVNEESQNNPRLREAVKRLCADTSAAKQEDIQMEIKDALAKVTVEDLKEHAPEVFEIILNEAKTEVRAEMEAEKPEVEADSSLDIAALQEELRETKAELSALKLFVEAEKAAQDKALAEKAEANRKLALTKEINDFCEGKDFGDARRKYLTEKLVNDKPVDEGAIEVANQMFEEIFSSHLSAPEMKAEPVTTGTDETVVVGHESILGGFKVSGHKT